MSSSKSAGKSAVWTPTLRTLYVVSALAGVATGLFHPLTSVLLTQRGIDATVVGAVQSAFFLCVIVAAPWARALMQRYGARATLAWGLMLTALSAVLLPWSESLLSAVLARSAMGLGLGLYMIGGQCALVAFAPNTQRGLVSALHGLAFGVGLGVGPLAGTLLYGVEPWLAFGIGAATLCLGVPLVLGGLPALRLQAQAPRYALARLLSVPLHAVFAYGVAEATLLTLFPVYLLQRGQSAADIGPAFAAFVVGGLLSALPLSHLADRVGREKVLLGCAVVGAAAAMALVWAQGLVLVSAMALLTGASLGPVYAIALAMMGQRLARQDLSAGSALFTTAFCLGSVIAPWLSALLMQHAGAQHVFTLSALLFVALALRLWAGKVTQAPPSHCAEESRT